jgi:hypothetical protein
MSKRVVLFGLLGLSAPVVLPAQDTPLQLALVQEPDASRPLDVQLATPGDGYLLLLHVIDGSVRVMFPGKPTATSALPAGEYNLERLSADEPWAFGRGGTIVAAWSATPIRTGELVRYGHWAVRDLNREDFRADPKAAAVALARRLGGDPAALAVSVEYDGPDLSLNRSAYSSQQPYRGDTVDLAVKVIRNLLQIQGNCPSGTRPTISGEYCTPPRERPRGTPPPREAPPVDQPARPIYAPPVTSPPPPATPARSTTPPPPSGGSHRKPL